ncbi:serine/threonine-protein phosphatase 2A 56 kDa regulatory subunit epsilon isoform [Drosophila mojavensis]|uniref:Serine/threonine protein phosphatase 2A regulatory subunit n=1 Tax=Drosophila mojavensis TaxID=7230 RepID=B4L2Q8_DROMO|nr:serine/threonine-protein phosphatase 2A 56 kDa regulatory subunit epsilon isoform [Drosophila mojavensis]EDW07856.1 uncharacterized protein Dmoj_GI15981 [Drosophila mojavensis]
MFLGALLEKINPFAKQSIKLTNVDDVSRNHIVKEKLPLLKAECSRAEREQEEFLEKLRVCCTLFDFRDASSNLIGKDAKLKALNEVLKFVDEGQGMLTDLIYVEIVKMVACNIIRTFPPNTLSPFNPDVDEQLLDATWVHLEVVYHVFLGILDSREFKPSVAKGPIDRKFVLQLLMLLNSADPRERGFLKWVILRIYSKIYGLRSYIRTQIYNIFYQFIYIVEDFNGIAELLWVQTTIFESCFTAASKAEHEECLEKILMPLHKVKSLPTFHNQLEQSLIQYLVKDSKYIENIVRGLIKFWPKTSTQKEILFLDEIDSYANGIAPEQFLAIQKPLLTQLATCVRSPHTEVAEHALNILNNKHMISLFEPNTAVVMPIICPALLSISKGHWNQTVLKRGYAALQLLVEMNPDLFNELLNDCSGEKERVKQRQRERELAWKKVNELVAKRRKLDAEYLPSPMSSSEGNITNSE